MKSLKLQAHEKPINIVRLNFDGDLLFTGSSDRKINLWNSMTGERIGCYNARGAVKSLDITNNSKYLFSGTLDGVMELFDVHTGELLGQMRREAKIKYMQFAHGDKYLLVVYESMNATNSQLRIYETESLKKFITTGPISERDETKCPIHRVVDPGKSKVVMAKWGVTNKTLTTCDATGFVHIYNLEDDSVMEKKIHEQEIKCISFANDYSLLITASQDGCKILNPTNLEVIRIFKQEVPMNAAAISPLLCKTINPKYHCLMGGGISARDAAMSKEGGFEIHLANIMYDNEIGTIPGHFGPVNTMTFHKDGRGFISGAEEGMVRIYRFGKNYFEEKLFE